MSDHRHTILAGAINQRNCFVNSALKGRLGGFCMRAAYLREKADYLRLARSLSAHSPTRRHLIVLAERLEQQAKEFEDARAQRRHDEAGNFESDDPEL